MCICVCIGALAATYISHIFIQRTKTDNGMEWADVRRPLNEMHSAYGFFIECDWLIRVRLE